MKISVDDVELFSLSINQKKVICNDINEDQIDSDFKRRLKHILNHKYEMCLKRLKEEWIPKLQKRYTSIPTNDDEICALIFSQPDYKSRKQRDIEEKKLLNIL